jgi:hypothetical protein
MDAGITFGEAFLETGGMYGQVDGFLVIRE